MAYALKNQIGRVFLAMFVMASLVALMVVPAFAQADLATEAKQAATSAVTGGVAVAAVILAAVILYRIIKKFSS
jgi:uncharacterized membrane protein (DUF485 family)